MPTQSIDAQLQKIAADLATLAASVKIAGVHKASDYQAKAGHYANDAMSDALDLSRNAFEDLRSELGSIEKAVVGRVRAHPLQAAIGIIGGLAILVALSSRRQ